MTSNPYVVFIVVVLLSCSILLNVKYMNSLIHKGKIDKLVWVAVLSGISLLGPIGTILIFIYVMLFNRFSNHPIFKESYEKKA